MAERSEPRGDRVEPEEVVDATAIDTEARTPKAASTSKTPAVTRPYPRKTLEDAMRVPAAIKSGNNGKPWAPDQVAKALGMGTGSSFFYLAQAARDFGFTDSGRDAAAIGLTDLGRKAVFPASPQHAEDAKMQAFLSVEKFKQVALHYGGSSLPDEEFVRNTLQTQFGLDPRVHDEFLDFFKKNCRFVGIGAKWDGTSSQRAGGGSVTAATVVQQTPAVITSNGTAPPTANQGGGIKPTCFVAMPFSERTDEYATGFFTEVYASLFVPAIEAAGFEPRTARRQGSDVIHATIVNDLLDADLVLVDLTEHNPNVLFELGIRIAEKRPTVLVKASGTNPIFDVDHLLRVESYNPNMWPSTVLADIPKLTGHIEGAWATKDSGGTYMDILRQVPAVVG